MVDTVEIIKGRTLTDDEYFKAALLGWCVELVGFTPQWPFMCIHDIFVAASLLPRVGRHDGPVHHSPRPTMLLPPRKRKPHCYQRLIHARDGYLLSHQVPLPLGTLLPSPAGALPRGTPFLIRLGSPGPDLLDRLPTKQKLDN